MYMYFNEIYAIVWFFILCGFEVTPVRNNYSCLIKYRVEYRAMKHTTWGVSIDEKNVRYLDSRFKYSQLIDLLCDNHAGIHIASNPMFNERTKYIEVDCHFIREKLSQNVICTNHVKSIYQLADLFTDHLYGSRVKYICMTYMHQLEGKCWGYL